MRRLTARSFYLALVTMASACATPSPERIANPPGVAATETIHVDPAAALRAQLRARAAFASLAQGSHPVTPVPATSISDDELAVRRAVHSAPLPSSTVLPQRGVQ